MDPITAFMTKLYPKTAVDPTTGKPNKGFVPLYTPTVGATLRGLAEANGAIGGMMVGAGAPLANYLWNGQTKRPAEAPTSAATLAQGLDFGTNTGTPTTTPQASAAAQTAAMLGLQILGGKAVVSSTDRDPKHNAEVGGVKNSWHLKPGQAADIVPKGMTMDQAAAALKASGIYDEVINEGDHVHVGGVKSVTSQMPIGLTGVAAPQSYVDPATMMGMVPNVRAVPHVKLPNAPQEELPAPMQELGMVDKASRMKALEDVIMPKDPHRPTDAWDRIAAGLAAAAQGASRADPYMGTGGLIGAAGGAFGQSVVNSKREMRAREDAFDQATQAAKIHLAELGIDIDDKNLSRADANMKTRWMNGEAIRTTKAKNANSVYENIVAGITMNHNVDTQNIGAANNRDLQRAQVGIGAIGDAVGAQNRANNEQVALNNREDKPETLTPGSSKILESYGIPTKPQKNEDPRFSYVRQAANYIDAKNVPGAVDTLATEIASTGDIPDGLLDPKASKAYEKATKSNNPAEAKAILIAAMDGARAAQAAAYMAAKGHPVGKMIIDHNKYKAPAK